MQIFVEHELGPPSSDELEVPPSGRVKGGSMNGGAAPSSVEGDPSSPAVASEDATLESSDAAGPPPPPPLPPLDAEQVVHESLTGG
jgi:hypothetical protein